MIASIALPSTSTLQPFLAFLRLEILRVTRNRRFLLLTFGFPLLFYLLYTRITPSQGIVAGSPWPVHFMVSMAIFGAIGASFSVGGQRLSSERASGWTRQLRITPLPPFAYTLTKAIAALAVTLPALIVVAAAAVVLDDVRLSPATWIGLIVTLWIGSLPLAALGLVLGFVLDADTAQIGNSLIYFGLAFLGGLFEPSQAMPSVMRQIAQWMPTGRLGDLGWRAVAGQAFNPTDALVLLGYAVVLFAAVAWLYRRDASEEHG